MREGRLPQTSFGSWGALIVAIVRIRPALAALPSSSAFALAVQWWRETASSIRCGNPDIRRTNDGFLPFVLQLKLPTESL